MYVCKYLYVYSYEHSCISILSSEFITPLQKCVFWRSLQQPLWDAVFFTAIDYAALTFELPVSARLHLAQVGLSYQCRHIDSFSILHFLSVRWKDSWVDKHVKDYKTNTEIHSNTRPGIHATKHKRLTKLWCILFSLK